MTNLNKDEISFSRDRYQVYEKRRFYILLISVSGFSIILGFASTLNSIIILVLLLSWVSLTNSIYYNHIKEQGFINAYLIKIAQLKNIKTLEEAFAIKIDNDKMKNNNSFNLRATLNHPFIIISLASIFISYYLIWKMDFNNLKYLLLDDINCNILSIYLDLLLKLLMSFLLLMPYLYIIIRSYREKYKNISEYDKLLNDYLKLKV